ncbi:unnamed protein product, partial [Brassica oleracea var. botrytis]
RSFILVQRDHSLLLQALHGSEFHEFCSWQGYLGILLLNSLPEEDKKKIQEPRIDKLSQDQESLSKFDCWPGYENIDQKAKKRTKSLQIQTQARQQSS